MNGNYVFVLINYLGLLIFSAVLAWLGTEGAVDEQGDFEEQPVTPPQAPVMG